VLKTMPGIDRPAIATFFPTRRGESVMLDLGANIECDADNLVQFALMGDVFARTALGLIQPTVGLLNVGSEDLKANDAVRGGIAVKSHGSTDAFGFANAISVAIDLKVNGFLEKIRNELAQLNKLPAPQQSAAL